MGSLLNSHSAMSLICASTSCKLSGEVMVWHMETAALRRQCSLNCDTAGSKFQFGSPAFCRALRLAAAFLGLECWAASTTTSSTCTTAKCARAPTGDLFYLLSTQNLFQPNSTSFTSRACSLSILTFPQNSYHAIVDTVGGVQNKTATGWNVQVWRRSGRPFKRGGHCHQGRLQADLDNRQEAEHGQPRR